MQQKWRYVNSFRCIFVIYFFCVTLKASLFEVPDIWNILPCNLAWNIAPIFGFGHIQHIQRASCCGITIQQKWRYVNSFRCLFILLIFSKIFFEYQHHFSHSFRQHFWPSVKRPFNVTAPDISFKDPGGIHVHTNPDILKSHIQFIWIPVDEASNRSWESAFKTTQSRFPDLRVICVERIRPIRVKKESCFRNMRIHEYVAPVALVRCKTCKFVREKPRWNSCVLSTEMIPTVISTLF